MTAVEPGARGRTTADVPAAVPISGGEAGRMRTEEAAAPVALRPIPVPAWLRLAFRITSAAAPGLARRWAHRLFFTPVPARRRPEDEERLAGARTFELDGRFGRIVGWAWGADPPGPRTPLASRDRAGRAEVTTPDRAGRTAVASPDRAGPAGPRAGVPDDDAPVVLLVHGWGGNAGQMTSAVDPLRAAGFRVIALDLPAHGRSSGKQSSLVHFADAIERAANHFGSVHAVVAHSFGAAATTVAMARGLDVKHLAYVSPPADFETFFRRFRAGLAVPDRIWDRMIRDAEAWLDVAFDDLVPVRLAPGLRAPLLVVHDRADREIGFDEGARLARAWPGAVFHATQDLGHLRILRDADVTTRIACFIVES